jgi:hypothetical protein
MTDSPAPKGNIDVAYPVRHFGEPPHHFVEPPNEVSFGDSQYPADAGGAPPKKRGRPKKTTAPELSDGQTQRGPNMATRKVYQKGQPQKFMDEIMSTGKYVSVIDETTGQGVFVGLFNPRSAKTESGRDVALVLFEMFRADESDCCKAATKMDKATGQHTCRACGNPCGIHLAWIRKPTYVPNPRSGGRMALWNQCTVQWAQIAGVIEGMKSLSGGAVEEKKEEIKSAREVLADKVLTSLRKYGI